MNKKLENKLIKNMRQLDYELYFVDEIILDDYVSNRTDYYIKTKVGYNYYYLSNDKTYYTVYKFIKFNK